MNYTTLGSLKDKLGITDTSSDSKLLLIIEEATKLIDRKIGYNLEKKDILQRIDGTGTNKLFLDHKPNEIIYIKNKNTTYFYTLDYIDNYILYLEEKAQKGSKNIEISYSIGFDTVPADIESICMELAVALSLDLGIKGANSEKFENKNIKNQKLGSLSVTYFSNDEKDSYIKDRFNIAIKENFDMIISKYKSFKGII